ncbi:MAG: Lrp/AsnC ligand binding domain-containing protein [Nitrososphaerota archaeon]|nr:Lrp/AsnC ligand binding domain-containing protein [Nitrososphaerales archaeon]MCX8191252.1 Lrp/AsnC ligand binding domain-containing protein [Nitrososphaerales archaeon]MDW8044619.1 Lrp/AsnC ligand binding domain-containing protein [Nitrososphaerota archaeon]
MPEAFILINCELGLEKEVLHLLKGIKGVEEAHIVYGVYDIIAKAKTEELEELKNVVINRIRKMHGIRSTSTLIVVEKG